MMYQQPKHVTIINDWLIKFILVLGYADEPISISEVARRTGFTYQYIHIRMLKKAFVLDLIRDRYSDNGFYRFIYLSERGKAVFEYFKAIGDLLLAD